MKHKLSTRLPAALAVAAAVALVSTSAFARNVQKEVQTAVEHSGYASKSSTLKMVHAHLHHTVNCLVGPSGAGFDGKFLNPCEGLGNGAIPDSKNMKTKKSLESALKLADKGLASGNLSMAQEDAHLVNGMLKKTEPTAK